MADKPVMKKLGTIVCRQTATEIENQNVLWHNAIPEVGYSAQVQWTNEQPGPGRNCYYVRVSQLNGQMAWSSPI